jgi:hypothetical protein
MSRNVEEKVVSSESRRGVIGRRSFLTALSLASGYFLSPSAIAKNLPSRQSFADHSQGSAAA